MAYETLSHVKSVLGISGTTWDVFIEAGITYCSVLADQWMYRDFAGVTSGYGAYTQTMNQQIFINGDDGVLLRSWPVQSIVGITHAATALVEDTGYTYDEFLDSGWIQFIESDGSPFLRWGKIDITWVTGWTEANLPATLRGFVIRGISYMFQRRMQEGVGADLMGDTQVTFRPPNIDGHSELKMIFDQSCGSLKLDVLVYDDGVIL